MTDESAPSNAAETAAPLVEAFAFGDREPVDVLAVNLDQARPFGQQTENRAGQDRLAGARSADEAEHLAAVDVEIEAVHDESLAETDFEPAHPDHRLG
jgi:hypothetical protein